MTSYCDKNSNLLNMPIIYGIVPPSPATPIVQMFKIMKPHDMPVYEYKICKRNCVPYKKMNQICEENCEDARVVQKQFKAGFNDVGYMSCK